MTAYPYSKVAIFGGSGFIGRYVVEKLAERGVTMVIPTRNLETAKFLRTQGDVGQINPVSCDIADARQIEKIVDRCDAVVNLLGILYQKKSQTFEAVHHQTASMIAKAAMQSGAKSMVHVSAIGANASSPARYAQSKALGEEAVRREFPDAVIVRPSIVFGPEDNFFNQFAAMARNFHVLPLVGGGATKFQPVYVCDVAETIVGTLACPDCRGKTFELGGPQIYSFKELMEMIVRQTGQKACLIDVPFMLAKYKALFLQMMPKPLLTVDQVRMLESDNVAQGSDLESLGTTPTALEAILPTYLDRYRAGGKLGNTNMAA